ncbi:MAG TPA: PilZ domain-containing protein [Candidatus Acidoferrales bacterium]|jgi:CheY-like chemotaxis protein|nr:PilZ domain-containing protein [Candidatus Acidoferrales bacterium]
MNLSSLLVCADEASVQVLNGVLKELGIRVELCPNAVRAAVRLAQERFDLIILDCDRQADVTSLLQETRSSRLNDTTLAVAVVAGQENIREIFSLGVNFVLYKPVSYERALSSLRAAQSVLYRDKRRKARAAVHTQATIDYAGVERATATLVDLAEDGMAVNFGKKLPPTCKVYFQFQLPGQTANVRLSGQVVWQDWNGRAGIQFVDVPQTSRRILREWLQMNLSDAPRPQLPSPEVKVEQSIRPDEDGVLTTSRGKKQDLKGGDGEAAARLRDEPSNRRGEVRYACRLGAEVYQTGSPVRHYCHLSDLSPGGCYLEMPLAFAAGLTVEIVVRTHEMKLRLSGEVKASHPSYGMGVLFHLNTKDERHGVQQLIDFVAAATKSSE